ncbi:MAG: twin-arginine translocase subunit TatC [Bacteroidales bacterium]|jgi:sec-independent protein translocase protein TatC|nr:twin-arginine translocase subunit TatC [Bacteroidales bacterium]
MAKSKNGPNDGQEPRGEMSFFEHLEELRWRIIRSVVAVLVIAIAAFIFKGFIFDDIIFRVKAPDFWSNRMFGKLAELIGTDEIRINTTDLKLQSLEMASQFQAHIWCSLIAGLIVAFPYVIYQIWQFISPALYEKERKYSTGAVFYISLLFIIGVLFGYYMIAPLSVHFLGNYKISEAVEPNINFASYIKTVSSVVLATGLVFQLPVFVFFLSKIGVITPDVLKRYRRHAYVGLLILSAIITPPDVWSQILVCVPLIVLYEGGIFISRWVQKREEAANS